MTENIDSTDDEPTDDNSTTEETARESVENPDEQRLKQRNAAFFWLYILYC